MIPKEQGIVRYQGDKSDSGVQIYRTNHYQTCVFNGRKHYLAEKGPQIANICSNRGQYVFKGSLGPFCGSEYGTKYGMTYKEDVAAVKESFCKMLENGIYKADLFSDL